MPDYYTVTWKVKVDADNPVHAAQVAREMMETQDDSDKVFDVTPVGSDDPPVTINLTKEYEYELYQKGADFCPEGHEYDMTEACLWCGTCKDHCVYAKDHKEED